MKFFGPKTIEVEIDGKKERRILRDCDKEIKYQSRAFDFKVNVLNKLEFGVESETKKIHEASESLKLLQKLSLDLCRDWNAGIVKREEYLQRTDDIRKRFLDFDSLTTGIKMETLKEPEVRTQFLERLTSWNLSTSQLLQRLQKIEQAVTEFRREFHEAERLKGKKLEEIAHRLERMERRQLQESKEKPAEEIINQVEALKTEVAGLKLENAKLRVKNAASHFAKSKESLDKGQYREAVEAFRDSAVDYEQALDQLPGESRATGSVYYNLGLAYTHLFLWEAAEGAYLRAAEIQRQAREKEDLARTYNSLGAMALHTSNYSSAVGYLKQCLEVAGPIGFNEAKANALGNMGLVYYSQGKLEEALKAHKEALEIHRQIGHRQGEANALCNIGNVYYSQGRLEEALKAFEEALGIHRQIGHRQGEANDLCNIGIVYYSQGRLEEALKAYKEALEIHRQLGHRQGEANALGNMGLVYYSQGKLEEALKAFEESYGLFSAIGMPREMKIVKDNIEALRLKTKGN